MKTKKVKQQLKRKNIESTVKIKNLKLKKDKKSSSMILDSVYEAAKDMHDIGVMDAVTMRKFELLCKKPIKKLTPYEIKEIRLREKVSQPVFAFYLNVQPTTVKKWETGENTPSGPALRLLNIIKEHNLNYISH